MSQTPSQYFGGSQDEAFERSLLEIPFPMEEQPSPSPSPAPSPPPDVDLLLPSSPQPDETVQLESLRRPQPTSPSPEPDETIQLLAKGEKDPKTAAAEASKEGGGGAPSASPSAWSALKRPPTAAEIEEGKRKLAFGASTFGGGGDYMRNKRLKLQFQNQERAQAEGPQIFKGVSIYINGYTQPSPPELRDMFLAQGGVFHAYLDKKSLVTHIIASRLTPQKIKEFEKYKVVTADWIVQSIEAGKLLPWGQFKWKPTVVPGASQVPSQRAFSFGSSTPVAQGSSSSSSSRKRDASSSSGAKEKGKGKETAWDVDGDEGSVGGSGERDSKRRRTSGGLVDEESGHEEDGFARMETTDDLVATPISTSLHTTVASTTTIKSRTTSDRPSPFLVPALPPSALKKRALAADPDAPPPPNVKQPGRPSYALHSENQAASKFMEQEEWRKAHTSASGTFIENYYKQSRLHWLSTWKAELINLVAVAQSTVEEAVSTTNPSSQTNSLSSAILPKITSPSKASKSTSSKKEKVILHCDFDAFFVSVGRLGREDLVGKPVVVCHSSGKGAGAASTSEVASPSYEAREFGVKAGMSLGQARQLCPDILSIPYDFEKYKAVALKFYTILISYADVLEAVSVDEALLEVTTQVQAHRADEDDDELDRAKEVAELIRDDVRAATGCEISIGIASNVLLARLASRKAKPAGSYHLKSSEVLSFLTPLKARDLWGFGREKADKIEQIFKTSNIGELRKRRVGELQAALGEKTGKQLFDACRGIDSRELKSERTRKSVSAEVNYGIRFHTSDEAETFVTELANEAAKRLRQAGVLGRALTLNIKTRAEGAPLEAPKFMGHGDCDDSSSTKAISGLGGIATADPIILGKVAVQLLRDGRIAASELRGIGIMITKLEQPRGKGASKPLEAGQGTLSFGKRPDPPKFVATKVNSASSSSLPDPVLPPPVVASGPSVVVASNEAAFGSVVNAPPPPPLLPSRPSPPPPRPPVPAQPTVVPSTPIQARPDISRVDPEIFAALPEDIRKELYPDWDGRDHRSASPARRGGSADALVPPAPEAGPSRLAASESPKGKQAEADVRRIVRQLAPNSKVQVSPQRAKSFFAALPPPPPVSPTAGNAAAGPSKPSNKLPARVGSEQEIVELAELLGADLAFLQELPANILRDQLSAMRAERDKILAKRGKLRPLQPKVDAMMRAGAVSVVQQQEEGGGGRTTRRSVSAGQEDEEGSLLGEEDENGSARGSSRHEDSDDDPEEEERRIEERRRQRLLLQRHQQQQEDDAFRLHRRRQLEASGSTIIHLQLGSSPNAPLLPHLLVHPPFPSNKPPVAHTYPQTPILGASKSKPKSKIQTQQKTQTLDDLRTFLDKWIQRDSSAEPRAAGTKMMGDFVAECFRVKGTGNKEKGMGVLKWWRMRIRQKFGERGFVELEDGEGDVEMDGEVGVGERWWKAWEEVWERVRKEVDGAGEKYGGVWEVD